MLANACHIYGLAGKVEMSLIKNIWHHSAYPFKKGTKEMNCSEKESGLNYMFL